MDKEYEYSFKVTDIKEFINYCLNNNYNKVLESKQKRTLYKNGGQVMARITENIYEDYTKKVLNFKDDNLSNSVLKVSRESKELLIDDTNEEFVSSLLDILELKEDTILLRNRYVYKKDNVKFEIDEYIEPEMRVVAIEGNKKEVDKVYKELESVIMTYKVNDKE